MSNALALAAVTAVLCDLLDNAVIQQDLNTAEPVRVTARPPDKIKVGDEEQAQLNLFLYQVTTNLGWSNVALPSHDHTGARISNPPLALDLHYLLTAYEKNDFEAEILLGYAMQVLHQTPVLKRSEIRKTLVGNGAFQDQGVLPNTYPKLLAADVAEQFESIKITPRTLNLEELSKLWTAFQSRFRTSAAYTASVVLIESKLPTRSTLPVIKRKLYVLPFKRPTITDVVSNVDADKDSRITIESELAIHGTDLKDNSTQVCVGVSLVPKGDLEISNSLITFKLKDIPATEGLRAGVQSVQVIHQVWMGEPETEHRGTESNVVPFVLHPTISNIIRIIDTNVEKIRVEFNPPVGKSQRVLLHLYEVITSQDQKARSYTLSAPKSNGIVGEVNTQVSRIDFDFDSKKVQPATYLVYVQVDGAESILGRDNTGKFCSPTVTIP